MNTKNKPYYLLSILPGLTLSFGTDSYLATFYGNPSLIEFQGTPLLLSANISQVVSILLAGSFGGLLYSLQNGELKLPHISEDSPSTVLVGENSVNSDQKLVTESASGNFNKSSAKVIYLGVIADCLIGIGGALVVFLILPGGEENLSLIKFLGTAIIGGYGGRSLLNQAVDGIAKRQEKIEKQVNQNKGELDVTRQELDATKQKLKAVEDQAQIDGQTLKFLSRHLDRSLTLSLEQENKLIENIQYISTATRTYIFRQTQLVLYENAEPQKESIEEQLVKNALKIFIALRDSDKNKDNDRYPAHIAYTYMSLKDWSKAIEQLGEAKQKLIQQPGYSSKQNIQDEIVYDCHLVICKVEAYPSDKEMILKELHPLKQKLATLKPPIKLDEIKSSVIKRQNPIAVWLEDNNLDVDTLQLKSVP